MKQTAYYPYPSRPGTEQAVSLGETAPLNEHDRSVVLAFEHGLYAAQLDTQAFPRAATFAEAHAQNGTPVQPLEAVWKKKANPTILGVDYFMTEEGRALLAESTDAPTDYSTNQECQSVLQSFDISSVDSKVMDKLGAKSVGHEEAKLTKAFIDAGYQGADLSAPAFITRYKRPDVLFEKAQGYRQLKGYIKQVKADLRASTEAGSQANDAQLLLANLYQKKVNMLLAATYVEAYKALAYTSDKAAMVDAVSHHLPAFANRNDPAQTADFLQNIDRYRHGVSKTEAGELTWLSPQAAHLAQTAQDTKTPEPVDRAEYADISVDSLHGVTIDGEVFGEWASAVLGEYGLLSDDTEWDSEHEEPAADGGWQVIVDDQFKSLSVNARTKIVMVPNKTWPLSSAVPLISHELMHVLQHHNKAALGDLAILKRVGLDAASDQVEAGGKWQERAARETMLGRGDTEVSGTGYYKALQVKQGGGSYGDCVQVYFEDLCLRNPDMQPEKAAAQAVNRARRIFRAGGFEYAQGTGYVTNSQPLSYVEQQLIYEQLDEENRKLLFVGGITIRNLAALSQLGLVDTDAILVPDKAPWQILQPKVAEAAKSK